MPLPYVDLLLCCVFLYLPLIFMIVLVLLMAGMAILVMLHQILSHSLGGRIFQSAFARGLFYVSAFFATPVHELSHAVMALLFGHKIQHIQFFQLGHDGRLGYVDHSWNRNSIYQSVGLFFIAIAPILAAICGVMLLAKWLQIALYSPSLIHALQVSSQASWQTMLTSSWYHYQAVLQYIIELVMASQRGWIWLLLSSLLCFHCIPSKADFNHALRGFVSLALLCGVLFALSYYFNPHHLAWLQIAVNHVLVFTSLIAVLSTLSLLWWLVLSLPCLLVR